MRNFMSFSANDSSNIFQFSGDEAVVSSSSSMSPSSKDTSAPSISTLFTTTSSRNKSTPCDCRKKRPKLPCNSIPGIRPAVFSRMPPKEKELISTLPANRGNKSTSSTSSRATRRESSPSTTSTSCTKRSNGNDKRMPPTPTCMPRACEACADSFSRSKFWTGGR